MIIISFKRLSKKPKNRTLIKMIYTDFIQKRLVVKSKYSCVYLLNLRHLHAIYLFRQLDYQPIVIYV